MTDPLARRLAGWPPFALFCISGVLGFLVDASVLYLGAPWLGWYGARALSFWAAATTTWWFNRRYTFTDAQPANGTRAVWRQYLAYLATMLVGGVVNYLAYVAVLQAAPWLTHPTLLALLPLAGVAVGSACGLVVNFASARWLIFRKTR